MTGTSGSWQPDPYRRHQLRWWDGAQWTSLVSDNGVSRDENAAMVPVVPVAPPSPPVVPKGANRGLLVAIVVAVALVAGGVIYRVTKDSGDDSSAGGSGESQSPAGQEYVDAMVEGATADTTVDFTADEVRCMAESVVDAVGVTALQGAGITPAVVRAEGDIDVSGVVTQAQAEQMADDVADCIDFARIVGDEMAGSDVKFTEEQTNCIGDKIGASDLIREMFVQSFMGSATQASQPAAEALGTEVVGCIDFGQLIADAVATSGIQLDAAAIACIGDGMNASELVKQLFVQQFLGGGGGDTTSTVTESSALSAANEMLHSIVGNLFGATDAATTDVMTTELSGIFANCGIDLGN